MPSERKRGPAGPVLKDHTPRHWEGGAVLDLSVACGAWVQAIRRGPDKDWLVYGPGIAPAHAPPHLNKDEVVHLMRIALQIALQKSIDSLLAP